MELQPNPSAERKSMEARFIRNIEQLHDNEIHLIMQDKLVPHPIACVNWAEYY